MRTFFFLSKAYAAKSFCNLKKKKSLNLKCVRQAYLRCPDSVCTQLINWFDLNKVKVTARSYLQQPLSYLKYIFRVYKLITRRLWQRHPYQCEIHLKYTLKSRFYGAQIDRRTDRSKHHMHKPQERKSRSYMSVFKLLRHQSSVLVLNQPNITFRVLINLLNV